MRNWLHGVLCAFVLFFYTPAWGNSEEDAAPLKPNIFGLCQFSIMETMHAKVQENTGRSAEYAYCSIHPLLPKNITVEFPSIFISGRGLYEREKFAHRNEGETDNGFIQDDNGRWSFLGTNILINSKMLKTSFTEERNGDETLLVGHQLIKGNIAQGGPISVPGIRILRITPEFVVSVDLNFQPLHYEKQNKGYKQLREAVSRELVDIVRSVQITPGVPGPTIRSNSAP